jgi:hypothetical protein
MSIAKSKAILAPGHGGLYGCEMLRIAHCVDSWLTDGGKVVSLLRRVSSLPRRIIRGTYFYWRLIQFKGNSEAGGLVKFKKSSDLIRI